MYKELYEEFLNIKPYMNPCSLVIYKWVYVFVKVLDVLNNIACQGMYDDKLSKQNKETQNEYIRLKKEKQELIDYLGDMKVKMVDGKAQPDKMILRKDHNQDKKILRSFTGLPLPTTYNEVTDKLDSSTKRRKSKYINAVSFIDDLKKNSTQIMKSFNDEATAKKQNEILKRKTTI